jgi:hypothetical protein
LFHHHQDNKIERVKYKKWVRAFMNTILRVLLTSVFFICLSLALLSRALKAQELQIGKVYETSVKVTDAMGGIYLPLPIGKWQLIGLQTQLAQGLGAVPVLTGALVSLDIGADKKPKALVTFAAAMAASTYGWVVSPLCSAKGVHYREPQDERENHEGGTSHCWVIQAQPMVLADKAPQYMRDAFTWIAANTSGPPLTMMKVTYYRTSGPKLLQADYLFNPEAVYFSNPGPAHFGAVGPALWAPERIAANAQQTRYVDAIKRFGIALSPIFERGFSGAIISLPELVAANIAIPILEVPPKASVVAGAPAVSGSPSFGQGQSIDCAEERNVKMKPIRENVSIVLQNHRNQAVDLYILDQNGQRQSRGSVEPAHNKHISMNEFRPWLVSDKAGQCLEIVFPGESSPTFVISQ